MSAPLSTSPPATPPPDALDSSVHWRFIPTPTICEWPEEYMPGRFHPIHFGDTFKDGQYRVIRKLGAGSYSTVWLAIDNKNSRYVALKVVVAKKSVEALFNTELSIYEHLAKIGADDPLSQHILMLLDSFQVTGPNGTHSCLVFKPMGSTTASMVKHLPYNKGKNETYPKYPKWMAKRILKHALSGLAFLHKNNVVHGDIQPGNLLFSAYSLDLVDEHKLEHNKNEIYDLHRRDGKKDRWSPRYLAESQSLYEYANIGEDFVVKISDMGAAFWETNPPEKPVTPRGLRAPELILSQKSDRGIDIWAIGCLIYEFTTGIALFIVDNISPDDSKDATDYHLLDITDALGPFPGTILSAWPRAHEYIKPDGSRLPESETIIGDTLEGLFAEYKSDEIDDEEAKVITGLIRQVLKYEPSERPSAAEILEHPWFKE